MYIWEKNTVYIGFSMASDVHGLGMYPPRMGGEGYGISVKQGEE